MKARRARAPSVAASLIVCSLVACRRAPREHATADDAVVPSASARPAWRCAPFVVQPWSNVDFPSKTNSDGTPKRLPPPPPNLPGHALVLPYDAFGPQPMAEQLVGDAWWSWEGGGSFEPGDSCDVRVVVHHDRPVDEIAKRYPTIEGKSDYRLVERDAAIAYLDEQIADLRTSMAEDEEFDFRSLIADLAQTRKTIVDCLGE